MGNTICWKEADPREFRDLRRQMDEWKPRTIVFRGPVHAPPIPEERATLNIKHQTLEPLQVPPSAPDQIPQVENRGVIDVTVANVEYVASESVEDITKTINDNKAASFAWEKE